PPCNTHNDFCYTHRNSTIASHWFYLLANGQGSDVYGIGIDAAAHIAFYAMTQLIGPNENFLQVRDATLLATVLLYEDPVPGVIRSPEYISVMNAWHAVGVGNAFSATEFRYAGGSQSAANVYPWTANLEVVNPFPGYVIEMVFEVSDANQF